MLLPVTGARRATPRRSSASVTRNSTRPARMPQSVVALSNSWSPVNSITICTVTVVAASSGLAVRFAESLPP